MILSINLTLTVLHCCRKSSPITDFWEKKTEIMIKRKQGWWGSNDTPRTSGVRGWADYSHGSDLVQGGGVVSYWRKARGGSKSRGSNRSHVWCDAARQVELRRTVWR